MRLARSFFGRDTRIVARELLGSILVHKLEDGARLSGRIVEVEAYRPDDQASHGYRGRTMRNAPMFMQPGTAYVYLIYGMHVCFNVSTETEGVGAAMLIRALEPLEGIEVMRANRGRDAAMLRPSDDMQLCRGPGNLCKALGIGHDLNGYDLCQRGSKLYIAEVRQATPLTIASSPRIGVSGDELAKTIPWRYYLVGHPCVSGRTTLHI